MPDTVCHQLLHFSIVMTDLYQQSLKERSKRILQSINSSVNRSVSDEVFAMYDELRLIAVDSKMCGKKFFGGIDFQQLMHDKDGLKLILSLIRLCHKTSPHIRL